MNLDNEILKLTLDLAKTGGQTAIWLLFGIQFLKIIQSSLGWIFGMWIIKNITAMVTNIIKFCIERDARFLEKNI